MLHNWIRARYLKDAYHANEVMEKLLAMLLTEAVTLNATSILFGEPLEGHAPLRTDSQQVEQPSQDLQSLEQELQSMSNMALPLFASSQMIPVWFKINGTWVQQDSMPHRLLHMLIMQFDVQHTFARTGYVRVKKPDGVSSEVRYQISMTSHYCYSIDLK